MLIDFFTCYDQADRPAQGHDDSICPANSVEAQKATSANKSFSVDQDLLVVTAPSQDGKSNCGDYVINPPLSQPHTPPGRVTHTSIAYDIQRDHIVFFKDSWRVACDDIMKEGDVYTILNKVKVPNIPCCSASGDVGDDTTYHSTSTDRFTDASWAVKRTHKFIPHQHHRLILDDIGDKLETFQCGKEMVYAI